MINKTLNNTILVTKTNKIDRVYFSEPTHMYILTITFSKNIRLKNYYSLKLFQNIVYVFTYIIDSFGWDLQIKNYVNIDKNIFKYLYSL